MKKTIIVLAVILMSVTSFSSCKCLSGKNAEKEQSGYMDLKGTTWVLKSVGERAFKKIDGMDADHIELQITAEGYFSTSDGCNNQGGVFTQNGSAISMTEIKETKRYCGPEFMKQAYGISFHKVTQFSVQSGILQLLNENGQVLADYTKK